MDRQNILQNEPNNSGNFDSDIDPVELLISTISSPTITCVAKKLDSSGFFNLESIESRILYLIIMLETNGRLENESTVELEIDAEELANAMQNLAPYNINDPCLYNNHYIFRLDFDDTLKEVFIKNINTVLEYSFIFDLKFVNLDDILQDIYDAYWGAMLASMNDAGRNNIKISDLAKHSSLTEEKLVENMWKYFKLGVLRISPEKR